MSSISNEISTKKECIDKIKSMMKERNLDTVYLEKSIQTTWPDDMAKKFLIRELYLSGQDMIEVWQGSGYEHQTYVLYLENFDIYTLSQVEKELKNTIGKLKKYRVQVISYVDVDAISSTSAEELVASQRFDVLKHLLWTELGKQTKKLSD